VVVNDIGSLLFLQIDLIVVNLLFGATSAGEYAIALQWAVLLRALAGVLSGVLTPTILSCYARKQTETLIRVTKSAVKLMGLAMALPIGLVCGFAPELLTLWVGGEFAFLWPLMVLLTVHLAVNLAVFPLFPINVAHNRVRVPGIVTFFMGIGNFGLAVALPLLTGWGYYGVAAAGRRPHAEERLLHSLVCNKSARGRGPHIHPIDAPRDRCDHPHRGLGGCPGRGPHHPVTLAIAGAAITLTYLVAVWVFGLDGSERRLFESYLPLALRRIVV